VKNFRLTFFLKGGRFSFEERREEEGFLAILSHNT
jgi:hypothetical protein